MGLQPNTLVFGRPRLGLDHDAVIRIGGEGPGDGPILWDGVTAMPASGYRRLGSLWADLANDVDGTPNLA